MYNTPRVHGNRKLIHTQSFRQHEILEITMANIERNEIQQFEHNLKFVLRNSLSVMESMSEIVVEL